MRRSGAVALAAITLVGWTIAAPNAALAQQKTIKDQLVGTWMFVSSDGVAKDGTKTDAWSNSKGTIVFDGNGRFAQILVRMDLPKLASRSNGSPKQDRAIVKGSLAYFGTYTVDEAAKVITLHFEGSSSAALNETDGKRNVVVLNGDDLTIVNPATRNGATVEFKWRRAKVN